MKQILFTPINPTNLSGNIVELLTEAILLGKLLPGQKLNEGQLAAEFHVSRTPIREALQQLQEQGLVRGSPNRGMFVVKLDDEDVNKINSLRFILESEALGLGRANLTPQGEKRLIQHVEKMERMAPEPANQIVRLDLEFHRLIWALTGNQYLEKILTSIAMPVFAHRVSRTPDIQKQRMAMTSHRPLLEFVQGKSSETAEEVMLAHLRLHWGDLARYSIRASAMGLETNSTELSADAHKREISHKAELTQQE